MFGIGCHELYVFSSNGIAYLLNGLIYHECGYYNHITATAKCFGPVNMHCCALLLILSAAIAIFYCIITGGPKKQTVIKVLYCYCYYTFAAYGQYCYETSICSILCRLCCNCNFFLSPGCLQMTSLYFQLPPVVSEMLWLFYLFIVSGKINDCTKRQRKK